MNLYWIAGCDGDTHGAALVRAETETRALFELANASQNNREGLVGGKIGFYNIVDFTGFPVELVQADVEGPHRVLKFYAGDRY